MPLTFPRKRRTSKSRMWRTRVCVCVGYLLLLCEMCEKCIVECIVHLQSYTNFNRPNTQQPTHISSEVRNQNFTINLRDVMEMCVRKRESRPLRRVFYVSARCLISYVKDMRANVDGDSSLECVYLGFSSRKSFCFKA